MSRFLMGVLQVDVGNNKRGNLKKIESFIEKAAGRGAQFISMPENINFIGKLEESIASAEPIPGETSVFFSNLAKKHSVWLHCGSYAELVPGEKKVYNTSIVVDPAGEIVAKYRKIHLYDVDITDGPSVRESDAKMPGREIVAFDSEYGRMGLSICYDMRFPELYRILALKGAQLMFVPANYTLFTGKDHWEVVLRTRAIENQCFLVAAGQVGMKPYFQAYGRSMIIDPWGTVIAQASDGEGFIVAEIDMSRVETVRRQLPSFPNRRPEAYVWE